MARKAVGLDIGSRYVKVAEMAREAGRALVVRWAVQEITDPSQAGRAQAVARAMNKAGVGRPRVVCGIPRSDAVVKRIRLPSADPDTARKMLAFEAQQHVPFPLDETAWDFDLGEDGSVLLVAARKTVLDDLRAVLAQAGLKARAVSVCSVATAAAYLKVGAEHADQPTGQAAVLVELGAGPVIVNVVSASRLLLSRPLSMTGEDLDRAFAADLGLGIQQGREVRERQGLPALPATAAHVAAWMQRLRGEVERSLLAAAEVQPSVEVEKVVAMGGGWQTPGLVEAFSSVLGLPVESFPPSSQEAGPALATAIGLGLQGLGLARGVNLLSAAVTSARKEVRRRTISAVAVAALLAALALGTWRYWALQEQSLALQPAQARAAQREAEIKALRSRQRVLEARLAELRRIMQPRHQVLNALKELSACAPSGIWLTSVTCSPGRPIMVQGRAGSMADVADLLDSLGSRSALTYVKQGQDNVDFAITMETREGG